MTVRTVPPPSRALASCTGWSPAASTSAQAAGPHPAQQAGQRTEGLFPGAVLSHGKQRGWAGTPATLALGGGQL